MKRSSSSWPRANGVCPHLFDPLYHAYYPPDSWRLLVWAHVRAFVHAWLICVRYHRNLPPRASA